MANQVVGLKFNPTYKITIYDDKHTVSFGYPLTASMQITKQTMAGSTQANFKILNLAQNTREMIYQDVFTFEPNKFKYIVVEAGYNGRLSCIYKGRILTCYSYKSGGQADVTTEIQAIPIDLFSATSSYTFSAGTSHKDIIKTLAKDMPNLSIANIGQIEGSIQTPTTFDGNTLECINSLTGGKTFIDDGNLNTLLNNEVIEVPVPVITDTTGLLETPIRRNANLEVKMLFEPTLIMGQLLEISSEIAPQFNGQYKVLGFTHSLQFGEGQAGQRITTVNLWYGVMLPGASLINSDGTVSTQFNQVKGEQVTPVNLKPVATWNKPVAGSISSPFGVKRGIRTHKGIDYAVPTGTDIKCPHNGYVSLIGSDPKGWGTYMKINHGVLNGKKIETLYAHLSQTLFSRGASVKTGQIIAKTGGARGAKGAGNSTGPHLHFELIENGTQVNPLKYIKG